MPIAIGIESVFLIELATARRANLLAAVDPVGLAGADVLACLAIAGLNEPVVIWTLVVITVCVSTVNYLVVVVIFAGVSAPEVRLRHTAGRDAALLVVVVCAG